MALLPTSSCATMGTVMGESGIGRRLLFRVNPAGTSPQAGLADSRSLFSLLSSPWYGGRRRTTGTYSGYGLIFHRRRRRRADVRDIFERGVRVSRNSCRAMFVPCRNSPWRHRRSSSGRRDARPVPLFNYGHAFVLSAASRGAYPLLLPPRAAVGKGRKEERAVTDAFATARLRGRRWPYSRQSGCKGQCQFRDGSVTRERKMEARRSR
ncbi:hypothetical protein BD310DRAFT_340529 [Dichomitus squalens]|uniref:Uncharacterized protein n=1 Tax=Dichomitus squalens TaxID=114155 RepID=A0A4Q9PZZ6_9APHY|nr:hypothetical protein BD310DRAFT_340529 [Dichomitus squalens]